MRVNNLGASGLLVSAVGLGCNNFGARLDLDASRRVVHRALDLGVTLFDTADSYGGRGKSEEILGECLGARRDDVAIATKFGWEMDDAGRLGGASRRYVMRAVEDSLRRLRTDRIDLYQLHKPDPRTPIEETLRALDDLVRQGKVRYIGCSNLPAWSFVDAMWIARTNGLEKFVSAQNLYNLLERDIERELLPAAEAFGAGLLPYFPLAGGLLSGKYRRDAPPPEGARLAVSPNMATRYLTECNWRAVERLERLCAARGKSLLELAVAWQTSQPIVASLIAGASTPEQLEANVAAAEWTLTTEDFEAVDQALAEEDGA